MGDDHPCTHYFYNSKPDEYMHNYDYLQVIRTLYMKYDFAASHDNINPNYV